MTYVLGPSYRNPFTTSQAQPDGADISRNAVEFIPFRIGGARLAFDGFADYNTPKGRDGAGRDTRARH